MSNAVWITKELLNTLIGRTKNIKVNMSETVLTPAVKCYGTGLSAGINIDLPKASGGGSFTVGVVATGSGPGPLVINPIKTVNPDGTWTADTETEIAKIGLMLP